MLSLQQCVWKLGGTKKTSRRDGDNYHNEEKLGEFFKDIACQEYGVENFVLNIETIYKVPKINFDELKHIENLRNSYCVIN